MFSLLTMLEAGIAKSHKSTYILITSKTTNIKLSHYRKFNKILVPLSSCATLIIFIYLFIQHLLSALFTNKYALMRYKSIHKQICAIIT